MQIPKTQGFHGVRGHASPEKQIGISGPQTAGNALKRSILHHRHVILHHFKSFAITSAGPFWFLGAACAPRAPPGHGGSIGV